MARGWGSTPPANPPPLAVSETPVQADYGTQTPHREKAAQRASHDDYGTFDDLMSEAALNVLNRTFAQRLNAAADALAPDPTIEEPKKELTQDFPE